MMGGNMILTKREQMIVEWLEHLSTIVDDNFDTDPQFPGHYIDNIILSIKSGVHMDYAKESKRVLSVE